MPNASLEFAPLKNYLREPSEGVHGTVCRFWVKRDGHSGVKQEDDSAFFIIVDGAIDSAYRPPIGDAEAQPYNPSGTLNIFKVDFVKNVRLILLTSATRQAVYFLTLFYGSLRSAPALSALLALRQSTRTDLDRHLAKWWLGYDPSSDMLDVSGDKQRKWVDSIVSFDTALPLLILASSTARLLRLEAQEALSCTDNPLRQSLDRLWHNFLLKSELSLQTGISTKGYVCSPVNPAFFELIFNQFGRCKSLALHETHSILIGDLGVEAEETLRVCALPAGGRLDNVLWHLSVGSEEDFRSCVILGHPTFDNRSSFGARIAQPLNAEAVYARCDSQTHTLVVNTKGTKPPHTPLEEALVSLVEQTWLGQTSPCTRMLMPLDVPDLISFFLLLDLLSLNLPLLKERVTVAVVTPLAGTLSTSLRLLLDSMAAEIREAFVRDKVYVIGTLLDGIRSEPQGKGKSDRARCHFLPDEAAFAAFREQNRHSQMLVLSSPMCMDYGASRAVFLKHFADDRDSSVVFLSPPPEGSLAARIASGVNDEPLRILTLVQTPLTTSSREAQIRQRFAETTTLDVHVIPSGPSSPTATEMEANNELEEEDSGDEEELHPLNMLRSSITSFFESNKSAVAFGDNNFIHPKRSKRPPEGQNPLVPEATVADELAATVGAYEIQNLLVATSESELEVPVVSSVRNLFRKSVDPETRDEFTLAVDSLRSTLHPRRVIYMGEDAENVGGKAIYGFVSKQFKAASLETLKKVANPQSPHMTMVPIRERSYGLWRDIDGSSDLQKAQAILLGHVQVRRAVGEEKSVETDKATDEVGPSSRPAPIIPPSLPAGLPPSLLAAFASIGAVLSNDKPVVPPQPPARAEKEHIRAVIPGKSLTATTEEEVPEQDYLEVSAKSSSSPTLFFRKDCKIAEDCSGKLADLYMRYPSLRGDLLSWRKVDSPNCTNRKRWEVDGYLGLPFLLLKERLVAGAKESEDGSMP